MYTFFQTKLFVILTILILVEASYIPPGWNPPGSLRLTLSTEDKSDQEQTTSNAQQSEEEASSEESEEKVKPYLVTNPTSFKYLSSLWPTEVNNDQRSTKKKPEGTRRDHNILNYEQSQESNTKKPNKSIHQSENSPDFEQHQKPSLNWTSIQQFNFPRTSKSQNHQQKSRQHWTNFHDKPSLTETSRNAAQKIWQNVESTWLPKHNENKKPSTEEPDSNETDELRILKQIRQYRIKNTIKNGRTIPINFDTDEYKQRYQMRLPPINRNERVKNVAKYIKTSFANAHNSKMPIRPEDDNDYESKLFPGQRPENNYGLPEYTQRPEDDTPYITSTPKSKIAVSVIGQ